MKLPPSRIHLLPLMKPLVFAELRIERTLLQPFHFHRKSRSEFLQSRLGLFLTGFFVDVFALFEYVAFLYCRVRGKTSRERNACWQE